MDARCGVLGLAVVAVVGGGACVAESVPSEPQVIAATSEESAAVSPANPAEGFDAWLNAQCPAGETLHLVNLQTRERILDIACEDVLTLVRTDAAVHARALAAYNYTTQPTVPDGVCGGMELKGWDNVANAYFAGIGAVAGGSLGFAIFGPIGGLMGGAMGVYIGTHDPWLHP